MEKSLKIFFINFCPLVQQCTMSLITYHQSWDTVEELKLNSLRFLSAFHILTANREKELVDMVENYVVPILSNILQFHVAYSFDQALVFLE